MHSDEYWIKKALSLAKVAEENNEVPVGAVLVLDDKVIGQGYNQSISSHDPTAHAEIVALREASKKIDNYRLISSTLYVTLEPCIMCAGAMVHARIKTLVYGAADTKTGAIETVLKILDEPSNNHRVVYKGGVLGEECGKILSAFFAKRRN